MEDTAKNKALPVMAALGYTGLCAGLSILFTDMSGSAYIALDKPAFQPEDNILLICWLAAFAMSAGALIMTCMNSNRTCGGRAVYIFALSMAMAAVWHYAFFENCDPASGFYTLCLCIPLSIYACVCMFRRNIVAGVLALGMPLWLCFLASLNYMIFMLN